VSTTRLVILGAVRIFQPVHGYFVRRELMTWRAEEWASLNPGSVYNALRTLARDGFLEEVATESSDGRPARTSYRLTDDGDTEFMVLLRDALWKLDPTDPNRLYAAVSFMWALSRAEVRAALEHRVAQAEALQTGLGYTISDIAANPVKPQHVAEVFRLSAARAQGEAEWARALLERIDAGEYRFAGEPEQLVKLD
jgi:DNA-binding PadR family transcriptional regulator